MKNLENIPKKNIFEVPDGYFDKLPSVIQSRVAAKQPLLVRQPYFQYVLKFALPVIIVAAAVVFIFRPQANSVDQLISKISTEQLMAYLEDQPAMWDELLDDIDLNAMEIDALEMEVYNNFELSFDTIDALDLTEF
ncbi:MAG: hypothetical protein KF687_09995 [Cyclobacteriaceae bacterium]|nr:hypothetical protein [Cyclobacteriaceae bacterium]